MKKVFFLFCFVTVFTVASVSAGNKPTPHTNFFKNVNVEFFKETKSSIKKSEEVNNCTATTTCPNGTTVSYTAATCAEAAAVIIKWLKEGGCQ